MSVFRVKMNQRNDLLDHSLVGGYSIQRTVYVMGPGKVNRLLTDGQTFTDCNYWQKFVYSATNPDGFLELVTDDGGTWIEGVGETGGAVSYTLGYAGQGYTNAGNTADIATDYGAAAVYTQIVNTSTAGGTNTAYPVRLNGSAVFTLEVGQTLIFDTNDMRITKVEVDATGAAASNEVQLFCTVKANQTS